MATHEYMRKSYDLFYPSRGNNEHIIVLTAHLKGE